MTMHFMQSTHWRAAALAAALVLGPVGVAQAQANYPSADAAAQALVTVLSTGDRDGLSRVLGPGFIRHVPAETDMDDVYAFLEAWSKSHQVQAVSETRAEIVVGEGGWRFPAPIVKGAQGWHFDIREGVSEIARRHIGGNELGAIDTLKALCQAQASYTQAQGRPATRLVSTIGARDGLYWPETDGTRSPLGSEALVMGADTPVDAALHGYHYRLIPGGGAQCAFVAWPARYGEDGVHSFVVSDGVVRERDLGRNTRAEAARVRNAATLGEAWVPVR